MDYHWDRIARTLVGVGRVVKVESDGTLTFEEPRTICKF